MACIKRRELEAKVNREHAIKLEIAMVGTIDRSGGEKGEKKVSIHGAVGEINGKFKISEDVFVQIVATTSYNVTCVKWTDRDSEPYARSEEHTSELQSP